MFVYFYQGGAGDIVACGLFGVELFFCPKGEGMFAVIFRAVVGELDQEYSVAIEKMKKLAFEEYGCLEFYSMMEGDKRVAISYWHSEEDIRTWKLNSEHLNSQKRGKQKWYESYTVQVVEVRREYSHNV